MSTRHKEQSKPGSPRGTAGATSTTSRVLARHVRREPYHRGDRGARRLPRMHCAGATVGTGRLKSARDEKEDGRIAYTGCRHLCGAIGVSQPERFPDKARSVGKGRATSMRSRLCRPRLVRLQSQASRVLRAHFFFLVFLLFGHFLCREDFYGSLVRISPSYFTGYTLLFVFNASCLCVCLGV